MSLAAAEPVPLPEVDFPPPMPDGIGGRGLALSAALHLVIGTVLVLGLPTLFHPPTPTEMPIAVQLVTMGPETRATHPNPNMPEQTAKLEPPLPAAAKPTPAPAPELARNEARVEAKKYSPGQFDALLRNLAAEDTPPSPEAPTQEVSTAGGRASAQPHAPLGGQLSASEMDMVREQISRCWNIPAGARDARDLVVEIRVIVQPDGNVQQAIIVDQACAAADPFFCAAAESARRAFFNPLCRPLHLPPDKFEIWKDMIVAFSPKDVL